MEDTKSTEICENENTKYIKVWRHIKLNTKGKMPLESLEEMELNETIVSIDGDRVFDLVGEGKILQFFK